MRMVINKAGVDKLLEIDPEHTVEIAKNAAAQVATEMANRISHVSLERKMSEMLSSMIAQPGWSRKLTSEARATLDKALEEASKGLVSAANTEATATVVRVMVAAELDKRFSEAAVSAQIDALIKQRFAAAFGGAS